MWLYFIVFAVILLAALWSMQIFMFQSFYEKMKTEEVIEVADSIADEYGQLNLEEMASYAYNSDFYIQIEAADGLVVYTPQNDFQRPVNMALSGSIEEARMRLAESSENTVSFVVNPRGANMPRMLTYAKRIADGQVCLYVISPLTPVESTVEILARQLVQVTILSLVLSFVLSFFISRKMTKPLIKITDSAGELAKGNYGVTFERGNYSEVDRLADTLTHTSKELARADNLQKDLLANVSHDLRTPLTMVKSYAEMIRDLSGDNPQKREAHLQVIIDEADRLNMLVGDLLTLSKMQSGVGVLETGSFDLKEAAAGILQTYDILVEQEGFRIDFECKEEKLPVWGDVQRIKQVISNLVGNAIRYGGEARHVVVRLTKEADSALCQVQDFGPGIPQDEIEHIWERYHRASAHTARSTSGGTGLGLSIVREILTLHEAEYGVESKEGEGSTFWFRLKGPAAKNTLKLRLEK
ncbi:MAG: hypothetical protein IJO79_02030 [Firmicutes bacterium]|nr:hypothetical protein [Bacillota bacterium]